MIKKICPMRPSGGPCVEEGCAWWNEDECAVLSIAATLYAGMENGALSSRFFTSKEHKLSVDRDLDEDVPF